MPAIRASLTDEDLWDWERMTGALAATEPWWEPGTRHAYHTNTYGHLIGEVVRRVSGERCGRRLAAVTGPLGADVLRRRPARGAPPLRGRDLPWAGRSRTAWTTRWSGDARMEMLSYFNPPGYSSMGVVNTEEWRGPRSRRPTATARRAAWHACTARCSSPIGCSRSICSPRRRPRSREGFCPILHEEVTFGLGFKPTTPRRPFGPNPRSFGHFGTGGAVGFADPDAGVAFGYVMNDVIPRWQSTRNRSLIGALYDAL